MHGDPDAGSSAVMPGDAVMVSYTPGIFKLREKSAAKAEAAALSATAVTNNTPSSLPLQCSPVR